MNSHLPGVYINKLLVQIGYFINAVHLIQVFLQAVLMFGFTLLFLFLC